MICENCKKEFEEDYRNWPKGPARFCSYKCARSFSTKEKRQEINEKVRNTLLNKDLSIKIEKTCPVCNKKYIVGVKKKNQIYCSTKCKCLSPVYKKNLSLSVLKRMTDDEKKRLRDIGRKGGFGKKGFTPKGTRFESSFEEKCFVFLEENLIDFEPHKNIPNSSKVSDIYFPQINVWVELDGINREKRKKWLEEEYKYWKDKIDIYKSKNLSYYVFTSYSDFELFIKENLY